MNYDDFKWYEGKNGNQYWVATKKIIPPLMDDGANYVVKYRESKEGDEPHKIHWENSTWELLGHYKEDSPTDAILQGKQELKRQGILPQD